MGAKDGPLHISRREHAKIVQSKLPNSHYLGVPRHFSQVLAHLVAIRSGIMGVHSYAGKYHAGMRLRQCQRGTTRGQVNSRINHASDATCDSSGDNSFAIGIKTGGINMRMAIDEQTNYPFQPINKRACLAPTRGATTFPYIGKCSGIPCGAKASQYFIKYSSRWNDVSNLTG